jgi:PAS domain-containing protein
MPSKHIKHTFDPLPDGAIACDREGKILRADAAALKLFEVPSEALCRGRDYQEFLQRYEISDEPQRAATLEPWLMSLLVEEDTACSLQFVLALIGLIRTVWCVKEPGSGSGGVFET